MSHTGVEIFDFLLFTIYPVIGLFVTELIFRAIKGTKWIKLWIQAIVCIGFGVWYLSFPGDQKFPLTAIVLFALSIALFYQGRRAKIFPDRVSY